MPITSPHASQFGIESHDPILSDREIGGMQGLRFEEGEHGSIYLRRFGSIMSKTKAGEASRS
jgi:hypothetical protein